MKTAPSVPFSTNVTPTNMTRPWPNPSIEGTSNIWFRQLSAALHVKRWA